VNIELTLSCDGLVKITLHNHAFYPTRYVSQRTQLTDRSPTNVFCGRPCFLHTSRLSVAFIVTVLTSV